MRTGGLGLIIAVIVAIFHLVGKALEGLDPNKEPVVAVIMSFINISTRSTRLSIKGNRKKIEKGVEVRRGDRGILYREWIDKVLSLIHI